MGGWSFGLSLSSVSSIGAGTPSKFMPQISPLSHFRISSSYASSRGSVFPLSIAPHRLRSVLSMNLDV